MKLDFIKNNLLYKFKNRKELLASLNKIHEILTSKRELIDEYLVNEKLVSAYTYFYSYTNSLKLPSILERISLETEIENLIDIGCGPGTYTFGLKSSFDQLNCVHGIDISDLMLKQAQALNSTQDVKFLSSKKKSKLKNSALFFGHSLNEMSIEQITDYIKFYDPLQIIAVMPGTSLCFEKMLLVRDMLISRNYNITYPCPSSAACPMDPSKDWCHQYIIVEHEQEIKTIMSELGVNRRNNPAIIFSFTKKEVTANQAVVVRNYPLRKFGYEFEACRSFEDSNLVESVKVLKKKLNSDEKRVMKQKVAGDYLKK